MPKIEWIKDIYMWYEERTLYMSIPFTWLLPKAHKILTQLDFSWDNAIIGGPAVLLMPEYLADIPRVTIGDSYPGILQMINPYATRTTTGCPNHCKFCGIGCGKIEPGGLVELDDWFDAPILCDNNLLAASTTHFDKVCDRLEHWDWCDFNQGLDPRLLTDYHASRLSRLHNPTIRLACDSQSEMPIWESAFQILRSTSIPLKNIKSYALIAFNSDPSECWSRCSWIEKHHINPLPMWFHPLNSLELNSLTPHQASLGWSDKSRTDIMGWFYKRRGEPH